MFKKFKDIETASLELSNNKVMIVETTITGYYIFWIKFIRVVNVNIDFKKINY